MLYGYSLTMSYKDGHDFNIPHSGLVSGKDLQEAFSNVLKEYVDETNHLHEITIYSLMDMNTIELNSEFFASVINDYDDLISREDISFLGNDCC